MAKLIHNTAMWTAIATVGLAIFGLVFRATFYWMIPVTPGEPAGLADMIELLIFYGVLLTALAAMMLGVLLLMVPDWRNVRLATSVLVTSLVIPPMFYVLHALVPRLIH